MQMAEVVRDLTWHEKLHHLTKRDTDYLAQATTRLAAEMALVSGTEIDAMERTIKDELALALLSMREAEPGE
jgi:RNA polymerase-interacting CarD/CdnL/TRCF family regulator